MVFFYAENTRESISVLEAIITLAVFLTATLILLLALRLLINDRAKVAVIVCIVLAAFFAYGPVHALLLSKYGLSVGGGLIGQQRYLLPIMATIVLGAALLVVRSRANWALLMRIGTATVLVLVIFNFGRIGIDLVRNPYEKFIDDQHFSLSSQPFPEVEKLPDIYYIVLDAYGRADVLKETYNFDNSDFLDSLTRKGFYVASDSRSNYVETSQSLAAALNMRYLTKKEDSGWAVKENAVLGITKDVGYQYIHLGSGWAITKRSKHADLEVFRDSFFQLFLNDFFSGLLRYTMAPPLAEAIGKDLEAPFASDYRMRFNNNMRALAKIADIPGPTFTFNHNLPPHPPFIFNEDGGLPQRSKLEFAGGVWKASDLYLDQLRYVNKMVESAIDDILQRSPSEPIIVIQGGHGPSYAGDATSRNPSQRFIFERTGILNVYYLPKHCRSDLYPSISPVNTFRVVFACLGVDFRLLEDRTYWTRAEPPIDYSQIDRR